MSKSAKSNQKPKTAEASARAAELMRARQKRYTDKATAAGQDIGEIPEVEDLERRAKALTGSRAFCEAYGKAKFDLPWSPAHLKAFEKFDMASNEDESFAYAMPRGGGKTSLVIFVVCWVILSGRHQFVLLLGGTDELAEELLADVVKAMCDPESPMCRDFPSEIYPILKLDGEGRKCGGQRYQGEKTHIKLASDRLVMPLIPGSTCPESVIRARGLTGSLHGMHYTQHNGKTIRPTFVVPDDPQTLESSRSFTQTEQRVRIIQRGVRAMAGPRRRTAIVIPCTVMEPGDLSSQFLDRKKFPQFRGEHAKLLYEWPTNKALWEQYREIRDECRRNDRSTEEARRFYQAHRSNCGRNPEVPASQCSTCQHRNDCMDCGAVVGWAYRTGDKDASTAIQFAMDMFYDVGPLGFASEYQNEPLANDGNLAMITAAMCAARFNGRPRGEVPLACTELTVGIDVQQESIWYGIMGWEPNFTGYLVDRDVWPRQPRSVFTKADIAASPNCLSAKYPGRGVEGAIQAGLEELIAWLLSRNFARAGGAGMMRVTRIMADQGKWASTMASVKHRIGGSVLTLIKGAGIKAGNKPMSALKKKPGEKHGDHWYTPTVKGTREFSYVMTDTNYWKAFLHTGLLTAPGDPGAITFYGTSEKEHELTAAHILAETFTVTKGHGREVHEFTLRPERPDNEFLDCFVYSTTGASYQGIIIPSQKDAPRNGVKKRRVPIAQLLAQSNQGGST